MKALILIIISYILGIATTYIIIPIVGMVVSMTSLEFWLMTFTFTTFYFFIELLILDQFS